ncbi:hypothetical protein IWX49DRAFT_558595, partial [Phyllosticta citricarpa]
MTFHRVRPSATCLLACLLACIKPRLPRRAHCYAMLMSMPMPCPYPSSTIVAWASCRIARGRTDRHCLPARTHAAPTAYSIRTHALQIGRQTGRKVETFV